jgi:hypothetical protein
MASPQGHPPAALPECCGAFGANARPIGNTDRVGGREAHTAGVLATECSTSTTLSLESPQLRSAARVYPDARLFQALYLTSEDLGGS